MQLRDAACSIEATDNDDDTREPMSDTNDRDSDGMNRDDDELRMNGVRGVTYTENGVSWRRYEKANGDIVDERVADGHEEPVLVTDGGFENPFPVEGTITPKENGYSASLPCVSEWLTETSNGNVLQRAVDRAARKYGNGTEVRVRFTSDRFGEECGDFELLGETEEGELVTDGGVDADVQNVRSARSLLSDYEDVGPEVRDGAIKHAIEELKNARRKLDDY